MISQKYNGKTKPEVNTNPVSGYVAYAEIEFDFPFESEPKVVEFRTNNSPSVIHKSIMFIDRNKVVLTFSTNSDSILSYEIIISENRGFLCGSNSSFHIYDFKTRDNIQILKTYKSEYVFHKKIHVQFNVNNSTFRARVISFFFPDIINKNETVTSIALVYIYQNLATPPSKLYSSMFLAETYSIIDDPLAGNIAKHNTPPTLINYNKYGNYNEPFWIYNVGNLKIYGFESGTKNRISITGIIIPSALQHRSTPYFDNIQVIGYLTDTPGSIKIFNSASILLED
jgi:hypothetical protein